MSPQPPQKESHISIQKEWSAQSCTTCDPSMRYGDMIVAAAVNRTHFVQLPKKFATGVQDWLRSLIHGCAECRCSSSLHVSKGLKCRQFGALLLELLSVRRFFLSFCSLCCSFFCWYRIVAVSLSGTLRQTEWKGNVNRRTTTVAESLVGLSIQSKRLQTKLQQTNIRICILYYYVANMLRLRRWIV